MFIEGAGDKSFDGLLPADCIYTVRVYLVRAAARRNKGSNYTLAVGVTGKPTDVAQASRSYRVPVGYAFKAGARELRRIIAPYSHSIVAGGLLEMS